MLSSCKICYANRGLDVHLELELNLLTAPRYETVYYTDMNYVISPRCDMLSIHIYLNSDANSTISYCVHCASMNPRTLMNR
jgi:hypothetical protein